MLAVSALSTIGLAAVLAAIAIRLYKREALLG
jgi:Tfp pilus assembly major pilin PilA